MWRSTSEVSPWRATFRCAPCAHAGDVPAIRTRTRMPIQRVHALGVMAMASLSCPASGCGPSVPDRSGMRKALPADLPLHGQPVLTLARLDGPGAELVEPDQRVLHDDLEDPLALLGGRLRGVPVDACLGPAPPEIVEADAGGAVRGHRLADPVVVGDGLVHLNALRREVEVRSEEHTSE